MRSQRRALVLPALAATAASAGAVQLPVLHHVTGDAPGDWFGYAVSRAGDVDQDGVPDFMVGAHQNLNGGHSPNPGYAKVYSGLDGHVILHLVGDGTMWLDGPDDHFGTSLDVLGDLTGDGYPELIVGAYKDDNVEQNCGMLRIFSGADGSLLHQDDGENNGDRMGISVSVVPDLTGDGLSEYMVGVYKDDNTEWNAGSVRVHSGADHALLYTFDGDTSGAGFGWSARPAGDVDGDGVGDIVVGSPLDTEQGVNLGTVWVHSGATGALLHLWYGDDTFDSLGHSVDGLGDVDGDGRSDLIAGAIESSLTGEEHGTGFARVYSGATGEVLYELQGDAPYDQLGYSVRGVGDVTGDGRADFLVGAPRGISLGYGNTGLPGYARLYSGRDGRVVYTFVGAAADDQFGVAVERVEDMDGDGLPEFLFGASEDVAGPTRNGYAVVVPGAFVLTTRYCTAASNSAGTGALLDHAGSLSVAANDFSLRAGGCPPNHFGLFYYGANAIQLPFGDGYRCVGGQTFRLAVVNTGTSGVAELALDLANPPNPAGQITPGSTWRFQFWYRDIPAGMSGFNLTDALSASFLP